MRKALAILFALLLIPVSVKADGIGAGFNAIGPTGYATINAGVTTATTIESHSGRLFGVLVTAVGSNSMVCYDNASLAAGNIVMVLPASAAVGFYPFNMPVYNGITCAGSSTNPAVTISFS